MEEWERTLCENKAVAILEQMQAGRPALIQKDGGEMLIAIVLDRPLADAKASVNNPAVLTKEMAKILLKSKIIHSLRKCSSHFFRPTPLPGRLTGLFNAKIWINKLQRTAVSVR